MNNEETMREKIYGDGYQDDHRDGYDKGYADAQTLYQRPSGHWIKDCDNCNCTNCYNSEARFTRKDCSGWCSNCGELQCCTDNFCPTCGADMRGGRE